MAPDLEYGFLVFDIDWGDNTQVIMSFLVDQLIRWPGPVPNVVFDETISKSSPPTHAYRAGIEYRAHRESPGWIGHHRWWRQQQHLAHTHHLDPFSLFLYLIH